MKTYLYHWVPKDLEGDTLYPLNALKEHLPELYKKKSAKYEGREQVMDWFVPVLNCKWNDVIHLTAVHPQVVKDAMVEAGYKGNYQVTCYEIDPYSLDPKNTVVYLYIKEPKNGECYPEEFVPFDPDTVEQYAAIPQVTKDYYRTCLSEGRMPLAFPWVPHIFYKGPISVKGLRTVTA